jgi:hypothetical protein
MKASFDLMQTTDTEKSNPLRMHQSMRKSFDENAGPADYDKPHLMGNRMLMESRLPSQPSYSFITTQRNFNK